MRLIVYLFIIILVFIGIHYLASGQDLGATVLRPYQGGTGNSTDPTKGDLLIGSSTASYGILGVGINGLCLTASSTAPYGVSWETCLSSVASGASTTSTYLVINLSPDLDNERAVTSSISLTLVDNGANATTSYEINLANTNIWTVLQEFAAGLSSTLPFTINGNQVTTSTDLADYSNATTLFIDLTDLSETITGIDYDNGTGIFSLEAGYLILTEASTTLYDLSFREVGDGLVSSTDLIRVGLAGDTEQDCTAGNFVQIISATGTVTCAADSVGAGGGGAPTTSTFIVISPSADLTDEREATSSPSLVLIDNGSNATTSYELNLANSNVWTIIQEFLYVSSTEITSPSSTITDLYTTNLTLGTSTFTGLLGQGLELVGGLLNWDYTISFTGDVTGSGSSSIAMTIANDAVDDTMIDWGVTGNQVASDDIPIGDPTDANWADGTNTWTSSTLTADALDDLNETMSYLAPDDATTLNAKALATAGTTFYTGKLSDGNTNYKAGDAAGATVTYIASDAAFSIYSPNSSSTWNKADEGLFEYHINGSLNDSVDLAANFVEAERAGDQSTVPWTGGASNLSITSVGWYNAFPKWQKGSSTAAVVAGDLQQGYNYFQMSHSGLSVNQTSTALDFFYDNDAGANPTVSTPTVYESSTVTRFISGIEFYDVNTVFAVTSTCVDCFDNVYHQTSPVTYTWSSSVITAGNITETDSSVTGLSTPPAINETMLIGGKDMKITSTGVRSIDARITLTPRDPYGSYTGVLSASSNRLVDSYTKTATDIYEYFQDEHYRIASSTYDTVPAVVSSTFASSTALTNGQAQVYNDRLYYPTIDFSGYLPTQTADYSGFSGDQHYVRAIIDTSNPHSNGSLELANLTDSDVQQDGSGNVNVFIKFPTQTGWLDLGCDYVQATFTGADGDCIQTSQSGDDWGWTAGAFSTANSGNMYILKVVFLNSTDNITQIRELGW